MSYNTNSALAQAVPSSMSLASPAGAVIICKRCQSGRVTKSGFTNGLQRYYCKDCGSITILNLAPFHSRLPIDAVVLVMERFYEGDSLASIRLSLEELMGIQVTVTGLEKMVYRFSRKALELAGDITPYVGPLWFLDGSSVGGARPAVILDVLDLSSGFLLASDLVPDFAERDRASVTQNALRLSGIVPEMLLISPRLIEEYVDDNFEENLPGRRLKKEQQSVIQKYRLSTLTRTQIISRRLNFDSIVNCRLICSAWRVNYNFLSGSQFGTNGPFNNWLDIVNAAF